MIHGTTHSKKEYNIHNTAEVWNQDEFCCVCKQKKKDEQLDFYLMK